MIKQKISYIILGIFSFSLLLIIYFLTLNIISELLKISMANIISYSIPIFTVSSISISAAVAIYVMKSNHVEDKKRKINDRLAHDYLNLSKSERILNDYIMIFDGYAKKITSTYDLQKISIDVLLIEVRDCIKDCKKIREFDYYYIGDRQVEILELTDELIYISKNIEILLITQKMLVPVTEITNRFNKMKLELEKFFSTSDFIKLND